MTRRASALALVATVAAALAACGSDDDGGGSGGSGGTGGGSSGSGGSATGGSAGAGGITGGAAGTGGAGGTTDAGATITMSGQVRELQVGGGLGAPIAGVQICLKDAATLPCVTTDPTGKYSIAGIPTNTEGVTLFTKTGYANMALVGTTGTTDVIVNQMMPTTALAQTFATAAGFTWPLAGKSIIGFGTVNETVGDAGPVLTGVPGAAVAITPASGKGPVYLGASSLPDTAATATSTAGGGFFGDLPPGMYTLKVTSPSGMTCVRGKKQGFDAGSTDSMKVLAIADFVISSVNFLCN